MEPSFGIETEGVGVVGKVLWFNPGFFAFLAGFLVIGVTGRTPVLLVGVTMEARFPILELYPFDI
jgi:hypothetical protein